MADVFDGLIFGDALKADGGHDHPDEVKQGDHADTDKNRLGGKGLHK